MTQIKVSIIIPCYNTGDNIYETFECLKEQTCKDFEVVLVNDGSTDDTLARLENFKRTSGLEVVLINKKNGGVSSARNEGIRNATGKYIAFLDSDDIYHKEFVKSMLSAIELSNYDVAYCKLSRNLSLLKDELHASNMHTYETQNEAMNRLLFKMWEYGFYCYLYRKDILNRFNIWFDENTKYGEDREFIWKYMIHCSSFISVNAIMYGYRNNVESATKKKANWRRTDSLMAVKRVEEYMRNYDVEFLGAYKDYMYARDMWAVAKAFAVSKEKELFIKLVKEYDVKTCMKRTARDSKWLVCIASKLFLIHYLLFYYVIGLKD